jgi:hypothetical protein
MRESAPTPGSYDPIPTIHFGPEETIAIQDLRVGDFVIKVPKQMNMRGLIVNSAVRTIESKHGWVVRPRKGSKSGTPMPGKEISFQVARDRTFSWPDHFDVIVRRPIHPDHD